EESIQHQQFGIGVPEEITVLALELAAVQFPTSEEISPEAPQRLQDLRRLEEVVLARIATSSEEDPAPFEKYVWRYANAYKEEGNYPWGFTPQEWQPYQAQYDDLGSFINIATSRRALADQWSNLFGGHLATFRQFFCESGEG